MFFQGYQQFCGSAFDNRSFCESAERGSNPVDGIKKKGRAIFSMGLEPRTSEREIDVLSPGLPRSVKISKKCSSCLDFCYIKENYKSTL